MWAEAIQRHLIIKEKCYAEKGINILEENFEIFLAKKSQYKASDFYLIHLAVLSCLFLIQKVFCYRAWIRKSGCWTQACDYWRGGETDRQIHRDRQNDVGRDKSKCKGNGHTGSQGDAVREWPAPWCACSRKNSCWKQIEEFLGLMVLTFLLGFTYFPILGMLFLLGSVGDKEGWRGAWQEVCTCLRHGGMGGGRMYLGERGPWWAAVATGGGCYRERSAAIAKLQRGRNKGPLLAPQIPHILLAPSTAHRLRESWDCITLYLRG